jgi:hypothetical protein
VDVGAKEAYLTIATYPFQRAFQTIQATAKGSGVKTIRLAGGGLGVFDPKTPDTVHLAYPGSDYQVEVFDPSGRARQVVASGRIAAIG